MTSEGKLTRLRTAALIILWAGIAGSTVLFLRAGQRTPRLLLLGMAVWMLSPFLALIWAYAVSKRWPLLTRATLYGVMIVVALASLVVYGDDAIAHRRPQAAFVYVITPPASWLAIAAVMSIAAVVSRRRSRRGVV